MTSSAASHAAVTGEVGLLADEHAQRLLSIFAEFALSCVTQLYDISKTHGSTSLERFFHVGLGTIQSWNSEVLREEVVRMESRYPEIQTLHDYVYLSFVADTNVDVSSIPVPCLTKTYHAFMRKIAEHPDIRRPEMFLSLPQALRRSAYVECFRASFHECLRDSGVTLMSRRPQQHQASHQASMQAPIQAPASAAPSPPQDAPKPQAKLDENAVERASSRASVLAKALERCQGAAPPPLTDLAPSVIDSQTKAIELSAPCFFGDYQPLASSA